MRQSESIAQLADDLAKAQGELKNASFNATNPHFKNKYADLAQLRDSTAPVLSKHGLSVVQGTVFNASENVFFLATRLLHKSGEWIESTFPLALDKSQAMGSAITYGRRYCLAAMLGIAGEPDDDGEATRANHQLEDIPLGMVKGEGASRHASNPLFGFLKGEMEKEKNLPDLNLWWVKNAPAVKRMNSEHQQAMFVELMKYGFHMASTLEDLNDFQTSHKTELKKLEDRSKKELEGLRDFYSYAQVRINKGSRPAVMDDENVQA